MEMKYTVKSFIATPNGNEPHELLFPGLNDYTP